jgi:hypothetical protein
MGIEVVVDVQAHTNTDMFRHLENTNTDKYRLTFYNEDDQVSYHSIMKLGLHLPVRWGMALEGRRLFSTSSGRFGFGHESLQEADRVCIFNGSRTAHILRPVPGTGASEYTLIGEAYVSGMMDGEIETLGLEPQEITLV